MRKIQIIAATAATLVFGLAGCGKDGREGVPNPDTNPDVAYLSIDVDMQPQGRASSEEEDSADESALKSLCLITFDETDHIVGIPGGSSFYIMLNVGSLGNPGEPQAVKVSAAAKNLVVIANPGPALTARLNTLTGTSTLATFNAAIFGIDITEIMGDAARGFTMITGGDETGKSAAPPDNRITTPYVDIDGRIVIVTGTDADARTEAEKPENRVPVKLERLAAKIVVGVVQAPGTLNVHPDGARFTFGGWTVDALNTAFFPFANKTVLSTTHTPTYGSYVNNFYTEDPNYDDIPAYHTGLAYGTVDGSGGSYAPRLPWNNHYMWKAASASAVYVTENTMAAAAQKYGNATRLVLKGTYTPQGCTEGADWFRWAGETYATLGELQTAYGAPDAPAALKAACDDFYVRIEAYYGNSTTLGDLPANSFATLTQAELDEVEDGGQVVRNGNSPVIRWYQKGLNYYFYEIRHDNEADGTMAFAKYGVVRNNSYRLTLHSVSGAGMPWYPDLIDGDPDPRDPIDETAGYLGLSVSVGEWVLWETGFGI